MNVVPNELMIGFDMRITPKMDIKKFEKQLETWAEEVSVGCLTWALHVCIRFLDAE